MRGNIRRLSVAALIAIACAHSPSASAQDRLLGALGFGSDDCEDAGAAYLAGDWNWHYPRETPNIRNGNRRLQCENGDRGYVYTRDDMPGEYFVTNRRYARITSNHSGMCSAVREYCLGPVVAAPAPSRLEARSTQESQNVRPIETLAATEANLCQRPEVVVSGASWTWMPGFGASHVGRTAIRCDGGQAGLLSVTSRSRTDLSGARYTVLTPSGQPRVWDSEDVCEATRWYCSAVGGEAATPSPPTSVKPGHEPEDVLMPIPAAPNDPPRALPDTLPGGDSVGATPIAQPPDPLVSVAPGAWRELAGLFNEEVDYMARQLNQNMRFRQRENAALGFRHDEYGAERHYMSDPDVFAAVYGFPITAQEPLPGGLLRGGPTSGGGMAN